MPISPNLVPQVPVRNRGRRATYDAIVIGSGVGGCVAAGMLAHRGASVLVLEKNPVIGGILASYERGGFKIDVGSHLISRGAHGPLAAAVRSVTDNGPKFLTHHIPVRSRGMFEITAPPHRRQLLATALEAARALELPAREASRLARMMFHVFTLTEVELRHWDRRTLDEFIRQHTEHPGAYFLFSFLASIFFVLPPWQVSAGESIRCLRSLLRDYSLSYVEGGMDAISHALLGPVAAADGDILTHQRVVAIEPRNNGVSVATRDGSEYTAPMVACNMAPADMLALIQGFDVPSNYRARVARIRSSGNAHQLKLGLRRRLVDEGCIIGGVSLSGLTMADLSIDLMRSTVDSIEVGCVSDPLAIYAPVPSNYDPRLAPDGGQLIVASIYGPVCTNPEHAPELWRNRALEAFEQIVPGIWDELMFAELSAIPSIGGWMGKSSRGAIANGQFPGQVGRDRLEVHTPIPGVYLCGDGAGGRGIGTELAASSGMEVANSMEQQRHGRHAA